MENPICKVLHGKNTQSEVPCHNSTWAWFKFGLSEVDGGADEGCPLTPMIVELGGDLELEFHIK
jgi:hypothetical protein